MLNVRRRRPGAEQVCLPVGDGSSKLGDPMHIEWVTCISHIMQILEDNARSSVDTDLMTNFSAKAVFERRVAKDNADLSAPLCKEFNRILRHLFRNRTISVQPAQFKTKTDCTWASMHFVLGKRSVGLHFLTVEPFFEVFAQPTGETLDMAALMEEEDRKQQELDKQNNNKKRGASFLPTPEKRPVRGDHPNPSEIPSWIHPPAETVGWTPPPFPFTPYTPTPIAPPTSVQLPDSLQQALNAMRAIRPAAVHDPMIQ